MVNIKKYPLSPLSFKIPHYMHYKLKIMINNGSYCSMAELVRNAIDKLSTQEDIIEIARNNSKVNKMMTSDLI